MSDSSPNQALQATPVDASHVVLSYRSGVPELDRSIQVKGSMKALAILTMFSLLTIPTSGQAQGRAIRPDIDKDIPLAQAIRQANNQFPDALPLTEEEVVAAVRAIKLEHPDIKEEIYETYMRVVRERVLPKGMYFAQTRSWSTEYGKFEVDWKDLRLRRDRLATDEERKAFLSKTHIASVGELRMNDGGFGYRIRARFISSRPLTEEEVKAIKWRLKNRTNR